MNSNHVSFHEKQYFRSNLWILFVLGFCGLLVGPGVVVLLLKSWHPVIILILLPNVVLLFVYSFGYLETKIEKDGVYVKLFPINFTYKVLLFNDILKFSVLRFSSIRSLNIEYFELYRKELKPIPKTYYIKGSGLGILIELTSGKNFLIETKKSNQFIKSLEAILSK